MDIDDQALKESIQSDVFHTGLAEFGEFQGFEDVALSEQEIEQSRSRIRRLIGDWLGK